MLDINPVSTLLDWEAAKEIRFEVFVSEQGVSAELELDDEDGHARHWLVRQAGRPVATARTLKRDFGMKVGRVAVLKPQRGVGIGRALMEAIHEQARKEGIAQLALESQVQAMPFYERLGYAAEGPEFMDAGIPHRVMRLVL